MSTDAPPSDAPPRAQGLRARKKAERWRRIVRAAREIFGESGYSAATIRAIASRADVASGTIFSYVRDKHDLLAKIFDEDLERLTFEQVETLPRDVALLDQLMHLFAPRFTFWARDPALSRQAAQDSFGANAAERAVYTGARLFHSRRSRLVAILTELLREKQETGEVRGDRDAGLAAHMLMDVYIGVNRRWLSGEEPEPAAGVDELRSILTIAIGGLAAGR
jgi:AcrR family transcriptional regulator